MEKLFLVTFMITLNALYWVEFLKSFNTTSDDGVVGKAIIGLIILAGSGVFIFNLDYILGQVNIASQN